MLITFSVKSKKFDSNYERNKFFRELYGWNQTVNRDEKRYTYRRHGVLEDVPHMRVDQSMFIILEKHMKKMMDFFDEWENKVMWDKFDVILNEKQERIFERCFDE